MLLPCTRISRVKADQSARSSPDLVVLGRTARGIDPVQTSRTISVGPPAATAAQEPYERIDRLRSSCGSNSVPKFHGTCYAYGCSETRAGDYDNADRPLSQRNT